MLDNLLPVQAHPDDEKLTWALRDVVAVTASSSFGQLSAEPFEAVALPGPAARLLRADTEATIFDDARVSLWSDTMTLRVEDVYGNGVSNGELEVSALDPILGLLQEQCGDDGAGAENLVFFDALLEADGSFPDCQSNYPTRGECGRDPLRVKTEADGEAAVGTILGDSHLVTYRSRVELRQVDLTVGIVESADPVRIPPPPSDPEEAPGGPVPLSYVVRVGNDGSHGAQNVGVEAELELPDGVELESVVPSRGSWSAPSWDLGALAAGASATLTLNLQVFPETVPRPDAVGIVARAAAPGDPVVRRDDDSASEATSVELDPDVDPLFEPEAGSASFEGERVVLKDGDPIPPLEFQYSVGVSSSSGTCRPAWYRFDRVVGLDAGAATRAGEPYPLPVDFIFFTADPEDCRAVPVHHCTGACVDACPGAPGNVVDCAYCMAGGAGCQFEYWLRDCEERSWTYRRAEIVLEDSEFTVTGGGSASAPARAPDGLSARTSLTAGPEPGLHEVGFMGSAVARVLKPNQDTGELEILPDTFPPWSDLEFVQQIQLDLIGGFHGLDLEITGIEPPQPELGEGGATESDVNFSYRIEPADYEAIVAVLRIEAGGEQVIDLLGSSLSGQGQAVLPRGFRFDPGQAHEARLVVNGGSAVEVVSDPVALPLGGQIIRRFDDPYLLSQDTDLSIEEFCPEGTPFTFHLNRAADVTLSFQRVVGFTGAELEVSGEEIFILEDEPYEAGEHTVLLSLEDLPPGDYLGTLKAAEGEEVVEEREFMALAEHNVADHRQVGQSVLRGVNLWKGNLSLSRLDLSIPGRGSPLELRRSYASSASKVPGVLGLGWTHNWDSRVKVSRCGDVRLTSGDTSLSFVDDGAGGLTARPGTHGHLAADEGSSAFDFFTVGGYRYNYAPASERQWQLERVTDPNGNTTTLTYSGAGAKRLLRRVADASGRALDFFYEQREFALWKGDVLVRVAGPDGMEMRFDYDRYGNLISADREQAARKELYTYKRLESWAFGARWLLENAIDGLNAARTQYSYRLADVGAVPGVSVGSVLVNEIEAPEGGVTRFIWDTDALESRTPAVHRVRDGRGHETEYRLNRGGQMVGVVDPLGNSSTMEWDTQNLVMTRRVDGNGVETDFTHDDFGNPLTETVTVTDFDGLEHVYTETRTYVPADQPPFQRNLLASRTDRRGHTTTFSYDERGNRLSRSIGVTDAEGQTSTVAEHHTYAGNGDRLTTTDPRGGVTSFRYDAHGYLEQASDPLGNIQRTSWNVRGLPEEITDPLGRVTYLEYDTLGRLTRRLHPDEAVELVDYFDGLNLQIEIDPQGGVTRTTTDREGRVVLIENAEEGQKVFEYDAEGNKTLESRWFDADTPRDDVVFEYDAAGRLVSRRETLGRFTTYGYDAVGNLISERLASETVNDGFVPRLTENAYDQLNRPIEVSRQLGVEGFVVTRQKLDGEGNKILELDPLDRTSFFDYDELGRLIRTEDAGTRVRRSFHDAASNLVRSELDNTVGGELSTQVRHFVYDAADRLISEADALGNVRAVEYDAAGNVLREYDRRGDLTSHLYDARNRRVSTTVHLDRVTDPVREIVSEFRYDLKGNMVGETLPSGSLVTHVYDRLDRLTSTSDSLGPVASYAYDARGNRVQETDANGNLTVNFYDVYDRLIHQQQPEDREVSFAYDVAGNRIAETDARGHTTKYRYDSLNRLVEVTDPLDQVSTVEYDAAGNKIRETDRRGSVTDFEYDEFNRLVLRTDPEIDGERYAVAFTYDAADNLLSELDRRGILTEYRYDLENRRTHTTRSDLLLEQVEYDAEGNVVSRTDANGNRVFFDYDERGQLIAERGPLEATTSFELDDMGDRLRAVDPEGRESAWTYDVRRRVLTETRGGDETTAFAYDSNGNRTSMERPEGGEWTYEYDGADRLTAVVNPESDLTEYTYDQNSNLENQTDGEQNTTSFEYDELDRQVQVTYPDSAVETRAYDPEGNLLERVDAKGQLATFTHDALNREVLREYRETETTPDAAQAVASTWDANNNLLTTVESERGDPEQTTSRSYDTFDRLESITDRWEHTLGYVYDANGNRVRLTDPDGDVTTYGYDGLNRVSSVVITGAGSTQYSYFKNSRLQRVSYPNGTTADYTYDASNRVATIDNRHVATPVSSFEYAHDRNGNRTQQIETHGTQPAETTTYGFDAADRLLEVAYPDKLTTYAYDAAGNRLTETDTDLSGDNVLADKSYVYNSRNQLTGLTDHLDPAGSVIYAYDANGNRVLRESGSGEVTGLAYDVRDRLTTIDQDGAALGTYAYDFQGLRVSKQTAESGLERYVYDDQSPLLRTNDAGRRTKYDYGPRQLLSVEDSDDGRAYYLFDALGSVSELTTPAGTVLSRYKWDAWGNKRSSVETGSNPFGFTGHEHDGETGLVYAKARFYDPETGVFLTHDPVFGDPARPPSLHRYLYAFQNPTVFVDPTGSQNEDSEEAPPELADRFKNRVVYDKEGNLTVEGGLYLEPEGVEVEANDRSIFQRTKDFFTDIFTFADSRNKAQQFSENLDETARGRKTTDLASLAAGDQGQLERTGTVVEDAFELGVEVVDDATTATGTVSVGKGLASAAVGIVKKKGKKGLVKVAGAEDLVDDAVVASGKKVPRGGSAGVDDFVAGLPRKNTPTSSPANRFEIEHTGRYNFTVSGGGTKFDIDGFRDKVILDAKHVGNPASSPFVEGSRIPRFIRDKIKGQQLDELQRIKRILADPNNPFTSLEIITNNHSAREFFEGLLKQVGVPARVVVR